MAAVVGIRIVFLDWRRTRRIGTPAIDDDQRQSKDAFLAEKWAIFGAFHRPVALRCGNISCKINTKTGYPRPRYTPPEFATEKAKPMHGPRGDGQWG